MTNNLPTRSQLRKLDYGHRESLMMPPHAISALIAAGYAREDEPDPQVGEVVWNKRDELYGLIRTSDACGLLSDENCLDLAGELALAKVVAERGDDAP